MQFRKTAATYEVQEIPANSVGESIIALFNQTRRYKRDATRFDWLYFKNPDGPAVLWTVKESATGELAGFTVALPRRMLVDGIVRCCWNCADFSIHPNHRSLGPAIKLRRAAKDAINAGQVDFLYAHPNEQMEVIH